MIYKYRILADFYIPGLSNDMNIAVQKNCRNLGGQIGYRSLDPIKNGVIAFYMGGSPGGNIPSWFTNWAAKYIIPGFLENLMNSNKNYPKWKKENDLSRRRRR